MSLQRKAPGESPNGARVIDRGGIIMREPLFSLHHCRYILKKAGAKQASSGASEELCKAIENIAMDISKRTVLFADDNARLKVTRKDVKSAVEEFKSEASSMQ